MCITVFSTAHPDYPFLLISNRDEFISRPTARAAWWNPPNQQVLGGRDLQREEHGTWLGITKQGRIACLTNFREEGVEINQEKSRGGIVNAYLTISPDSDESEEEFVRRLLTDVGIYDVGGFTLLFGKLRAPSSKESTKDGYSEQIANGGSSNNRAHATSVKEMKIQDSLQDRDFQNPIRQPIGPRVMPGLAVISNRTASAESLTRIGTHLGENHGLSNSHYGDRTWPKVVTGEQLLARAIEAHVSEGYSREKFISSLFDILSVDTLPCRKQDEDWVMYVRHMRNSIMIPAIKGEVVESRSAEDVASAEDSNGRRKQAELRVSKGAYGTQKQTVILVNYSGMVTFVERTLYDENGKSLLQGERDITVEFEIERWEE